jgi:hypothetical protein
MGNQGDDRRGGDDNRWRDRGRDERWGGGDRGGEYRGDNRGWNEGRREDRGWGPGAGGGHGDGGFFQRAGEEVRSWFGNGPDDQRSGDTGQQGGGRSHEGGSYGWMSNGWGNQAGESWNRDRPGVQEREGWFTDSVGGERGQRPGGPGGDSRGVSPDYGRGFAQGPGGGSAPAPQGGSLHDPHYSEWRRRQIEDLDRDYDEYRREHQSKFESDFGGWRQKRQGQRQMLNKVAEHMEVVGSDGQHIGTVDAVRGDRIVLTKADPNAGGVHHSIPCGWVENVDDKVTVNKTAEEAMQAWRSEDRSRALFEREDSGSPGPHMLNRSFSGTYKDRDD